MTITGIMRVRRASAGHPHRDQGETVHRSRDGVGIAQPAEGDRGRRRWINNYAAGIAVAALVLVAAACGSTTTTSSGNAGSTTGSGGSTASTAAPSNASLFPNGITLAVGCSPGCVTDVSARLLASYLSKEMGVTVKVTNVLGGGGSIATQQVCKASPKSGELVALFLPQGAIGQEIGNIGCNVKTLTPISDIWGNSTSIMITKPNGPLSTWQKVSAYKGNISVGVVGVKSSAGWLASEYLHIYNHVTVTPVPFSGSAQMISAVLGGQVQAAMVPPGPTAALIKSGKLAGAVAFSAAPLKTVPTVPAIGKVGSSSEVIDSVSGFAGPPGMSKSRVNALSQALSKVAANPAFVAASKKAHYTVAYQGPSAYAATIASDDAAAITAKTKLGL